ncbi:MAG: S1 RNA-binding domain-containing protein [Gemmatimonadaceae bacterium]
MQVEWTELAQRIATLRLDTAWTCAPADFPPGTVVDAPVVSLTSSGAGVQLSPMITGLVPTHELGEPAPIHAGQVVKIGETLRCVVINVWPSARLILLASKRVLDLREAAAAVAWREAEQRYHVGSRVIGRVASFTDDGVQVALSRYVSGIVAAPADMLSGPPSLRIGDTLECFVTQLDCRTRQLALCNAITSRKACA